MPNSFKGSQTYVVSAATSSTNSLHAVEMTRAPSSTDTKYTIGQIWVHKGVGAYVLTNLTTSQGIVSATWSAIAGPVSATTLTASGDITTTAGNVVISGAGKGLQIEGGAVTDTIGTGTLAAGTVTIANTNIAATDRIFIQRTAANASTTLGELSYTISAGASFTVTSLILGTPGSTQTGDLSSFTYLIVRQL